MKLKKFTGLLLCAALALSMAACKFTTPAVVMTVEGEDIPAGLYLMYQYQAYSSAKSKLEDKSAKVLKSEIEGVKAEEWIHNETVASAKRYVWVEKAFAEAGLTFTEEEQASIDSQLDAIWANNEALLAANGIGRENYRRFYECEAKYEKLLAEYQDGESDKITDAEAKKYMDETYSRIQTLVLPTTDADSAALPDEKLEELNALAAQLADDLNAGGSMDELGPETLEKAFEICGREYAEDTASSYMSKSFLTAESTSYSEEFVQGVVAAEVGAAGVYDGYSVPMIYQKIANYEDNDDFTANYKTTILSEITSAAFSGQSGGGDCGLCRDGGCLRRQDIQPVQDSGIRLNRVYQQSLCEEAGGSRLFCAYMFYHPNETGGQKPMAQFSIRPARPEDCGTILELIRGIAEYEKMSDEVVATEETIRHAMFDEHVTRCLLAELDGKVIGYALYFYNYSTFIGTKGLYLEDLFLYPEYRKAGYGKRLIRELFKIAAAENCGRMEWCCLNWNTPSQEFYKSLGAKPMDEWTTWRLTKEDLARLAAE